MHLATPEIAWHETLPIYSCDLQQLPARLSTGTSSDVTRPPLVELPLESRGSTCETPSTDGAGWTRLATAGGDNVVRLWRVSLDWKLPAPSGSLSTALTVKVLDTAVGKKSSGYSDYLSFLSSLRRHEKPVNVVRWSYSGKFLASGGDDLFIIIWTQQQHSISGHESGDAVGDDSDDEAGANVEHWVPCKTLRRHNEGVYDLCWSPDDQSLLSGSVDHSTIIWQLDLTSTTPAIKTDSNLLMSDGICASVKTNAPFGGGLGSAKSLILRDHKHYVQGVAWDPMNQFVVSLGCDRSCFIYRVGSRNYCTHAAKNGKQRLFQDDSWKSFFRRLVFSPDGAVLVCPAGNIEEAKFVAASAALAVDAGSGSQRPTATVAPQHAAHIFLRTNFQRPAVSLPTGARPVVAVRFCPQPFQLRLGPSGKKPKSVFDLPYRWIFCLILEDGLLFYDTQQMAPFAQVSQIHYQALNDAAWSSDGRMVVACSTDGYCSFFHFAPGELGLRYRGPIGSESLKDRNQSCAQELPPIKTAASLETEVKYTSGTDSQRSTSYMVKLGPNPIGPPVSPSEGQAISSTKASKGSCNDVVATAAAGKRRITLTTLSGIIPAGSSTVDSPSVPIASSNGNTEKRRVSFVTLDRRMDTAEDHPMESNQTVTTNT